MILFSTLLACQSDSVKLGEPLSDFELIDVNANSETYDTTVRFTEFETRVSAWYFGHAT